MREVLEMVFDAAILLAMAGWLALWLTRETGRLGFRRGSGLAALRVAGQEPPTGPEDHDDWPSVAATAPPPSPPRRSDQAVASQPEAEAVGAGR